MNTIILPEWIVHQILSLLDQSVKKSDQNAQTIIVFYRSSVLGVISSFLLSEPAGFLFFSISILSKIAILIVKRKNN